MSSVHQIIPWAGHVNDASSKGGVQMLMATLAQELAPQGIRVNAIAPGAIRTPINRDAGDTPEAEADLLRLIPYRRVATRTTSRTRWRRSRPTSSTTSWAPRSTWTAE